MSLLAAVCGGVLAGASFFFALAETALFSLGKWQARRLVERSPQRGGLVARLLGSPQDLLATIVLGNTCANAGLVTVGLWMVLRGEWSPVVTPIVVLLVILVGGEVIPKTLAVRAPESWSLRVARPMLFVLAATRPARQVAQRLNQRLLDWLIPKSIRPPSVTTAEDYAELLDLAYQQGA